MSNTRGLSISSEVFGAHTAQGLIDAYRKKYWQCQDPGKAKVIFLGLDANWDEHIEHNHVMYPELLHYLDDGVLYWKKHGIHHPFLLPAYNKQGGYTYHRNFRKTEITSEYAEQVSFVEILAIPTYGRSSSANKQFMQLIDLEYLKSLNDIIFNASPKVIFIAKSVYDKLIQIKKTSKVSNFFNFDMDLPSGINYGNRLMNIHSSNNVFVFVHTHFSGNISNDHVKNMGNVAISFMSEVKQKLWWEITYTSLQITNEEVRYISASNLQDVNNVICKQLEVSHTKDILNTLALKIVHGQEISAPNIWC